jgi:hypothetical protein
MPAKFAVSQNVACPEERSGIRGFFFCASNCEALSETNNKIKIAS